MSVAENREALLRAARRFSTRGERERYLELYDDAIVFHGVPGVEPGIASVRAYYEAFWAAFPDAELVIHHVVAEGDDVACRFTVRGTQRGDFLGIPAAGRRMSTDGMTILRFANGRCVERWSQTDFAGMLQQLTAAPEPAAAG